MANITTRNPRFQPDWVFNFVLKLAVAICLATLAIGLITGVGPLTSLLRSGIAFVVFATLAWAASLIWPVIEIEEEAEEEEGKEAETEKNKPAELARDSSLAKPNKSPRPAPTPSSETEAEVTYEPTSATTELEPVG